MLGNSSEIPAASPPPNGRNWRSRAQWGPSARAGSVQRMALDQGLGWQIFGDCCLLDQVPTSSAMEPGMKGLRHRLARSWIRSDVVGRPKFVEPHLGDPETLGQRLRCHVRIAGRRLERIAEPLDCSFPRKLCNGTRFR